MPATLKLFCQVQGDEHDLAFEVEIDSSKSVYALKEVIKPKMGPDFNHVPARSLALWKVSSFYRPAQMF